MGGGIADGLSNDIIGNKLGLKDGEVINISKAAQAYGLYRNNLDNLSSADIVYYTLEL